MYVGCLQLDSEQLRSEYNTVTYDSMPGRYGHNRTVSFVKKLLRAYAYGTGAPAWEAAVARVQSTNTEQNLTRGLYLPSTYRYDAGTQRSDAYMYIDPVPLATLTCTCALAAAPTWTQQMEDRTRGTGCKTQNTRPRESYRVYSTQQVLTRDHPAVIPAAAAGTCTIPARYLRRILHLTPACAIPARQSTAGGR